MAVSGMPVARMPVSCVAPRLFRRAWPPRKGQAEHLHANFPKQLEIVVLEAGRPFPTRRRRLGTGHFLAVFVKNAKARQTRSASDVMSRRPGWRTVLESSATAAVGELIIG